MALNADVEGAYADGLSWAQTPVGTGAALLGRRDVPDGALLPLDYVVELRETAQREIPDLAWRTLIELVPVKELPPVAFAAYQRADHDRAIDILTAISGLGDPEVSPAAMVNLGVVYGEAGRTDDAIGAYTRAIDSGHPDEAPKAMFTLGFLYREAGRTDDAIKAYTRAIDSGHPDHAPKAMVNLGFLYAGAGRTDDAIKAYTRAIDSGHPDVVALAKAGLASLESE